MIPKVIHYCWFGKNPKSKLIKKCIESWKKHCPDYEIIEWNENNYETDNIYFQQAYSAKKWAFAADFARLDIIYRNGGIYLDTDVELLKSLDDLLAYPCYVGTEKGIHGDGIINTGLGFGAEPQNEMVKAMLDEYRKISFAKGKNIYDLTPCPVRNTKSFAKYGYEESDRIVEVGEALVFPNEYFAPRNYVTRELKVTNNSYSIHHYEGAWMPINSKLNKKFKTILGPRLSEVLVKNKLKFVKK